jgi:hypothetical protein
MTRLFATVGILVFALEAVAGVLAPGQLVEQLGSEDYRRRESAAAALRNAGPEAIPALRAAAKSSDDPEVRRRAAAILRKLQFAAVSGQMLKPRKVKLDYREVPLGAAFGDLRKRTGLNLALDPARLGDPLRKVTCSTGEVTVWEALDAFCAAAGLCEEFRDELEAPKRPHPLPGGYGGYVAPPALGVDAVPITLVAGKLRRVAGDRRTAVRVLVLPPSFPGHRVTLGTGDTTLCFDITPAPGLHWQEVSAVKLTRLIDDAGRVGRAANPNREAMQWGGTGAFCGGGFGGQFGQFGNLGGQFGIAGAPGGFGGGQFGGFGGMGQPRPVPNPHVYPVALKLATPHARSLKRLEGSVFGEIALPNQTLATVDDPEKNVGVAFSGPGDVRFTLVSLTRSDDGVKAELLLEYPSPWAVSARRGFNPGGLWPVEAPRSADQYPTPRALDAAGKPMQGSILGGTSNTSSDGQMLLHRSEWRFPKSAGVPAKFVVVGPRPVTVEVPFSLENVPLP